MKRFLLRLLVATVLLAGAVAYLAPATLIPPAVERASRGGLAVSEIEGTLWHGRGVLAAGYARLPFAWTLDAVPLLTGAMRVHVKPADAGSASPYADITAAPRRLALAEVAITFPAAVLQQAFPPPAPGGAASLVDGEIAATTRHLEWTPAAYDGGLRVVWRNARVTLGSVRVIDLGDATATLSSRGNRLAGPVINAGGNLDVRGDAAVGTDGSATISLLLTPRRSDDAELARLLAAIGMPDGAGWRVNWQTRTP
jgi:hypothetical protein